MWSALLPLGNSLNDCGSSPFEREADEWFQSLGVFWATLKIFGNDPHLLWVEETLQCLVNEGIGSLGSLLLYVCFLVCVHVPKAHLLEVSPSLTIIIMVYVACPSSVCLCLSLGRDVGTDDGHLGWACVGRSQWR
jgi:hypothetical protein